MASINLLIGELGSVIAKQVFAFLEFELRKQVLMEREALDGVLFREAYFGEKASALAGDLCVNRAIYPIYYLEWTIDKVVGLNKFVTSPSGLAEQSGYYEGIVILRNKRNRKKTRRLRVIQPFTFNRDEITYHVNATVTEIDLNKEIPDMIRVILEAESEPETATA